MNRRSFIKRTALAVGIATVVAKAASLPVKARVTSSVRSMTFDLRQVSVEFQAKRMGNRPECFERSEDCGPWEEIITATRHDTGEIEKKIIVLDLLDVHVDAGKVTILGEFFEEETNERYYISSMA